MNLPELVGSEKQVAWAQEIRANKLASRPESPTRAELYDILARQTDAKWWIDNRDRYASDLVSRIIGDATIADSIRAVTAQFDSVIDAEIKEAEYQILEPLRREIKQASEALDVVAEDYRKRIKKAKDKGNESAPQLEEAARMVRSAQEILERVSQTPRPKFNVRTKVAEILKQQKTS